MTVLEYPALLSDLAPYDILTPPKLKFYWIECRSASLEDIRSKVVTVLNAFGK
jgi:hypothetical protein